MTYDSETLGQKAELFFIKYSAPPLLSLYGAPLNAATPDLRGGEAAVRKWRGRTGRTRKGRVRVCKKDSATTSKLEEDRNVTPGIGSLDLPSPKRSLSSSKNIGFFRAGFRAVHSSRLSKKKCLLSRHTWRDEGSISRRPHLQHAHGEPRRETLLLTVRALPRQPTPHTPAPSACANRRGPASHVQFRKETRALSGLLGFKGLIKGLGLEV